MKATLGAWNRHADAAPIVDSGLLAGTGGLVVIAPHPDDETLGCSALLVDAARRQRPIAIVALTDGDASHPGSRAVPPDRLAALRAGEQQEAVAALGCTQALWLRLALPDGASRWHEGRRAAVTAVLQLCAELGATAIAAPHPDDPHPDHHAAADLALDVRAAMPSLRVLFYEVWACRLADDAPFRHAGLSPFRVETPRELKRAAIACHRSQLGLVVPDSPDGFVLPGWFLAHHDGPHERLSWLDMPGTLPDSAHFDALYRNGADPWHVRSSTYEIDKRARTRQALGDRRFRHMLELGCGEGHLSREFLASGHALRATGIDQAGDIIDRARTLGPPAADFIQGTLPEAIPAGPFDLVLLSEMLYFFSEPGLIALAARLSASLQAGAVLVLVCYLGRTDTPMNGDAAADFFIGCFGRQVRRVKEVREPLYRLDVLEWHPAA